MAGRTEQTEQITRLTQSLQRDSIRFTLCLIDELCDEDNDNGIDSYADAIDRLKMISVYDA